LKCDIGLNLIVTLFGEETMIEFICEHCETYLSIAVDQIGDEIFCPACEEEVKMPKLSPQLEAKLAIALAQSKTGPKKRLNPKTEELLQEPDSQETKIWKERLAQSFKASSFRNADVNEKTENLKASKKDDSNKSGIGKIFDIFSNKEKE